MVSIKLGGERIPTRGRMNTLLDPACSIVKLQSHEGSAVSDVIINTCSSPISPISQGGPSTKSDKQVQARYLAGIFVGNMECFIKLEQESRGEGSSPYIAAINTHAEVVTKQ